MTVEPFPDLPAGYNEPIDWEQIEGALCRWVIDELGLDGDRVVWANQNIVQPDYPFVTLQKIAGPTKYGPQDELRHDYDSNRPQQQEIEMRNQGPREFTIAFQAHADPKCGANNTAGALLSKLQSSLGKQSVLDQLWESGLSVVRDEGITPNDSVVNGEWISRETMDVVFMTGAVMVERTTFIDKAQVKSDELDVDFIVDAS